LAHLDGQDLSFEICPDCNSSDFAFEKVTLQFGTHMVADGSLAALGVEQMEHKDFPIVRCRNCQKIALSEAALVKIMPALANFNFELHAVPPGISNAHELN